MEGEREREPSTEEHDQLSRSTKKMKRAGGSGSGTLPGSDMDMDIGSPRQEESAQQETRRLISYRETLQRNNPNLTFETRDNPIWMADTEADTSDDEEPAEEEDPLCPTIRLTAAEKRVLREPWRNALIIRMFDKGIGYLQLKRRLKAKWALRGDFSLIDIGCDYYVTRFTNMEDYDHVMLNGPWMIGDNYLVIREWVPNFVPEEDHITKLTAWVRVPKLSVEYFNRHFLLHKIGHKIGRVLKIDSTTENVERGQYTRMCVEVDLTKPLLSKFRLNGKVWGIQYEGLKMICFHCGRQGHKEDNCELNKRAQQEDTSPNSELSRAQINAVPDYQDKAYGSWMLVKKPTRRSNNRNQRSGTRVHGQGESEPGSLRVAPASNRSNPNREAVPHMETSRQDPQSPRNPNLGSRYRALAALDLNLEADSNILPVASNEDSLSNLATTSSLVRTDKGKSPDIGGSRNGKGNPENRKETPMESQRHAQDIEHNVLVNTSIQTDSVAPRPRSGYMDAPRPNNVTENSRPQRQVAPNPAGLLRSPNAGLPNLLTLDDPPGDNSRVRVGHGEEHPYNGSQPDLALEVQETNPHRGPTHGNMDLDV